MTCVCVCVCVCVCACSSAYFFRPDVFTVQHFFAFCLVALMGRFVPLLGTAFFCGTTSTAEEEVEEEKDEEEEELLPSSEVAALSLPLDESLSAEDLDSIELASSSGFQSQSERPREASEKDALLLSTAFATFKVILGFITMGIFLARPFFFSSSCPTTTQSVKSTVLGAHKWANWLPQPCRIGDPHRCRAGGKIRSGPQVGKVATSPLPYRGSPPLQSGGKIRSGPQVGKMATSPLPYRGSPPLQSGGQNQKWPTSGQSGYLTPAASGIPTSSKRGAKSEMSEKRAEMHVTFALGGVPS